MGPVIPLRSRREPLQAGLGTELEVLPLPGQLGHDGALFEFHPTDRVNGFPLLALGRPDLEQFDVRGDALQPACSDRGDLESARVAEPIDERLRDEQVMTIGRRGDSSCQVHTRADVVAFAVEHRAGVGAHAHRREGRFGSDLDIDGHGIPDRVSGIRKTWVNTSMQ